MSYQAEREEFVARMTREGLSLDRCRSLLRAATALQRYAELACSSEAAARDRVPCPHSRLPALPCLCEGYGSFDQATNTHGTVPRYAILDYQAERRAERAVPEGWRIVTQGDPRGYTLRVIPPSYAERNAGKDRFNVDAIGVPARETVRW